MRFFKMFERKNELHSKKPLAELAGYNQVIIENHEGIGLYSAEEVQIKVSYGRLRVIGNELCLRHISHERLAVVGCIDMLQIIRRQL